MTGNPVRQDLQDIKFNAPEAFNFFNLSQGGNMKTLLVIGGSLVARTINECNTSLMKSDLPYIEARFAIHNIFKFLHLEYVRRLTYLDNPDIHKWGIRCKLEFTF